MTWLPPRPERTYCSRLPTIIIRAARRLGTRWQADSERRAGHGPSTEGRAAAIARNPNGERQRRRSTRTSAAEPDHLHANYTQPQVIGVTVEVRRVPQEAAGSGCAAMLLYFGAVVRPALACGGHLR
jgi:hypothetical protein